MIGDYMESHGVKFIRGCVPDDITDENGKRRVKYTIGDETKEEVYDTVLLAIGRTADTKNIGLESVGVKINEKNGKIIAND